MKNIETIRSDVLAEVISRSHPYKCAFCNYIKECKRLETCSCKHGIESWLEAETVNN